MVPGWHSSMRRAGAGGGDEEWHNELRISEPPEELLSADAQGASERWARAQKRARDGNKALGVATTCTNSENEGGDPGEPHRVRRALSALLGEPTMGRLCITYRQARHPAGTQQTSRKHT